MITIERKNIIGHGDIASVLPEQDRLLFFASGVSNSRETRESEYQREIDLLMDQEKTQHLVYFSSLAIFYSNTRYSRHKLLMEELVRTNFAEWTVIRLGNIDWGNNPNTIINYLRNKVKNKEPFELQDTYRYIVDQEEFLHWINLIPNGNCEMNIPGRRMKVTQIFQEYCVPKPILNHDLIYEHA